MDIGNIISRSANIVWRNKALWLLGFLVALGSGGGGGTSFNLPSGTGSGSGGTGNIPGLPNLPRLNEQQIQGIVVGVVALLCILGIVGLIFAIVGVIANGGLIAGADEADATGKTGFRRSFSRGAGRFWSLLGMRFVLAIPGLIVGVLIVAVSVVLFGAAIAAAVSDTRSSSNNVGALFAAFGGALCILIPVGLVGAVWSVVVRGIEVFGDRAIVLESAGAMDGIRRGWSMFKSRFTDVFLTGLVLWVIGIIAAFVLGLIAAAIMAPGVILVLTQINTQVQTGTWIFIAVLLIISVIVTSVLASLLIAFRAVVWTLVYRVFVPRPAAAAVTPLTPIGAIAA